MEGEVISDSAESDEDSEEDARGGPRSIEGEADEDSDTENQSPLDELTTAFPAGDIAPIILRIIIRNRLEAFPYHNEEQHVNESKFLDICDEIRTAV